jgi:hypothetical protein
MDDGVRGIGGGEAEDGKGGGWVAGRRDDFDFFRRDFGADDLNG